MSHRIGFVQACAVGAALIGAASVFTDAMAQELFWTPLFAPDFFALDPHVYGCCEGGWATGANAWTNGNYTSAKWPPDPVPLLAGAAPLITKDAVVAVPYWWTHGEIEAGYRGFTNASPRVGEVYLDQQSLAKYYEYSTIAPGAFGGGHVAAGSSDGLYQVDLWANNVGYNDQSYWLDASKAGEHYLSVEWDQTPHFYSTSAQTPFLGAGSPGVAGPILFLPPGFTGFGGATTSANLVPFLHVQDIGIERDTASVAYRWTPTDAWDIRADYSHMTRKGSQVAGIVQLNTFAATEVPAPVNDTTQNFGASGEYAGTWLSGQKYTIKVAYTGSQYTDNMSSYFVQNPYFPTIGSCTPATKTAEGTANCVAAQVSTPPSNAANGVSATMAGDLPLLSRYVGTVNYTKMTQNDSFIPMTDNPLAVASPFNGGALWNTIGALPRTSLDGAINTLLSNNVVTTKITPELTSKLTYRYYDYDNQTPRTVFPCWIHYDGTGAPIVPGGNPCGAPFSFENTISSLSPGYTKQNAGAALNWRPSREWNVNAEYGYERYNYTQADVNVTNENSSKVSVDWKPTGWFTFRASGSYGVRTYEEYNYQRFVESIQFPTVPPFSPNTNPSWFYAPAYRQFMFDHRERTTANLAIDLVAFRGITITPTFKYKDDYYGLNPLNQEGVDDSRQMSWGIDTGYVVSPNLTFALSYYWEFYTQTLYNYTSFNAPLSIAGPPAGWPWVAQPGNCSTGLLANCLITTGDREHVRTFTALVNWAAVPDTLNLTVRYTASLGVDQQALVTGASNAGCSACAGAFPDVTTWFQRLDATATYKFDRYWLYQMGWTGDLKAKLRYTWERNSVANWQNDLLAPFTPSVSPSGTTSLWLGYDNPNYNIQMIAASMIASW